MGYLRKKFRSVVPRATGNRFSGQIDLDLFARDWKSPLAKDGLTDFFRDAAALCLRKSINSLWVNPPWTFYIWLGDWLQYNAVGKLIFVVTPEFKGYHKRIAQWNVDWIATIPFPAHAPAWFTRGNGTIRSKPTWSCDVRIGIQRPIPADR